MKCKCKSNVNEHVNLHVAFLATYFTKKLQKVNLDRKSSFFYTSETSTLITRIKGP